MKLLSRMLMISVFASLFSACLSDGSTKHTANIRVTHASQDAPAVDVSLNGNTSIEDLAYASSTNSITIDDGDYNVDVAGITTGGNVSVINADLTFDANNDYEIVALNTVSSIEPKVISKPRDFDGEVRVQVLHAASTAPQVDVHVTAPGAALSAGTVLGSFSFKEVLGPVEIGAGDYQIRVTLPGSLDPIFDSGTVNLPKGADLLISAVVNTQVGDSTDKSPISLVVATDDGSSVVSNATDGAEVRVVHNASDAPAVDVYVEEISANAFSNLAFANSTDYAGLPAGNYKLDVRAAGTTVNVLNDVDVALSNGQMLTVVALGDALDDGGNVKPQGQGLDLLVLSDDPRGVATDATLRVVHGAIEAPTVDVYLTATDDVGSAAPAVPSFAYKSDTGYINVPEGSYYVTLYGAGANPETDNFAFQAGPVSLSNGGVYTVIARAATTAEAPNAFGLTILAK